MKTLGLASITLEAHASLLMLETGLVQQPVCTSIGMPQAKQLAGQGLIWHDLTYMWNIENQTEQTK